MLKKGNKKISARLEKSSAENANNQTPQQSSPYQVGICIVLIKILYSTLEALLYFKGMHAGMLPNPEVGSSRIFSLFVAGIYPGKCAHILASSLVGVNEIDSKIFSGIIFNFINFKRKDISVQQHSLNPAKILGPPGFFSPHKEWQNNFPKYCKSLTRGAAVWPCCLQ